MVRKNKNNIKKSPQRFINRELSWLNFNERVLKEAQNNKNPILERLRFLSISGNNLDEFHMVRVAGLFRQLKKKIFIRTSDGRTTRQQYQEVAKSMKILLKKQQLILTDLREKLEKEKIRIIDSPKNLKKKREIIYTIFEKKIFSTLTPLAIDPAHPFPFLPNLSLSLVCSLKNKAGKTSYSLVILPPKLKRFFKISKKEDIFVSSENIILQNLKSIFPDYKLAHYTFIRIIRDSDIDFEEEAEDLLLSFETALKKRRRGEVVGLYVQGRVEKKLLNFLRKSLKVKDESIFRLKSILDVSSLNELIDEKKLSLCFKPFKSRYPQRILDFKGKCFSAIKKKDILIHHPFESFDVVVNFLQQASKDPKVISIKQTLYRTSSESPIIEALKTASNNGKSVTAVVELKARFDEEKNIQWAKDLEKSGVNIVYGFLKWKTHAKISLISRQEDDDITSYVHFGTGNYHPITAKIYTDLSYFSCNEELVNDALKIFNFITGYTKPQKMQLVSYSPTLLRNFMIELIDNEIINSKKKLPAEIWIKVNSLIDDEIIDKLYEASQAGVKIFLIVRGICGLRPGVKNLSENIFVKSLVGRFLEHSRIYCFANGKKMPDRQNKIFISSADMMTRNLDRRVETFIPIINDTVHKQVLEQIMISYLKDNTNSWVLDHNGVYKKIKKRNVFSAHNFFINNPSLSGRGSHLQANEKK
jgi:polyphosphate kinase|tara:strand:- start:3052 stop:5154 length:2103 start_codon:yes stop_codon:yes gene_type:complete